MTGPTRRALLIAAAASPIVPGMLVLGRDAWAKAPEIYTAPGSDLGAGGYDVIAYFDEGRALRGREDLAAEHKGARWLFASEAHRAAFLIDPEAYLPQFGGHCSWAVSRGYTAKGDPEAWRVVDGKLYLNFNKRVRARWDEDRPGNIAKGEANWPGLRAD
ncbi:MAG: YHS domain-containing (seleno)protein [Pikeienuella sp.]